MHPELRGFLFRFFGVVAMTLLPLVFITFMSLPLALNRHPGDAAPHQVAPARHMT